MRPLRLSMTAFGPYAGTEVVDFDPLADLGLFVVAGRNGAGKTTIFDGLYFALYGALPGRRSQYLRMRSDHAAPDVESVVEFDFAIGAQRWRIRRSPKQTLAKKRGTGSTERNQRATLYRLDGDDAVAVVNRINEVNEQCRELVGLTGPQFERVALLPQGEFSRLLRESSTQRRDLLRALFSSDVFGDATTWLTDRAGEVAVRDDAAREAFDRQLLEAADRVATISSRPVEASIDYLRSVVAEQHASVLTPLSAEVDQLRTISQRATAEHQAAVERAERHARRDALRVRLADHLLGEAQHSADAERLILAQAAIPVVDMAHVAAKQAAAHVEAKQRTARVRERLEPFVADIADPAVLGSDDDPTDLDALHALRRTLETAIARDAERARLDEQIAEITHAIEQLDRERETIERDRARTQTQRRTTQAERTDLDTRRVALAELPSADVARRDAEHAASVAARRQQLDDLDQQISETTARLDEALAEHRRLEAEIDALSDAAAAQHDANGAAASAADELAEHRRRLDAARSFEQLYARLEPARAAHRAARHHADALFDGFVRGTSARLAETLTPGDACPVCGSEAHPQIAEPDDTVVTEAQVHSARAAADATSAAVHEIEAGLETLRNDHPGLGLDDVATLAEAVEIARARALAAENRANEHGRAVAALPAARQATAQAATVVERHRSELHDTEASRRELVGSLGSAAQPPVAVAVAAAQTARAIHEQVQAAADELLRLTRAIERQDQRLAAIDQADRRSVSLLETNQAQRRDRADDLARRRHDRSVLDDEIDGLTQSPRLPAAERAERWATTLRGIDRLLAAESDVRAAADADRRAELLLAERLQPSPFDTIEQARAAFLDDELFDTLRAATTGWATALDQLRGELRAFDDLGVDAPDIDGSAQLAETAASAFESAQTTMLELRGHLERLDEELDGLARHQVELDADADEARRLERVAALVKGDNELNTSLENWVLAAHLRDVVELANVRLAQSTGNRFQLCVLDDGETRRNRWGLDLAVEDTVTGTRRPTAGLSGGELFQTSLALALGLADVVMSQRAGVRIDALFIDEGFGSLDETSVERAIDLLDELRGRGAMVGVITHVPALLDSLPRGITVVAKTDGTGSTIEQHRLAA